MGFVPLHCISLVALMSFPSDIRAVKTVKYLLVSGLSQLFTLCYSLVKNAKAVRTSEEVRREKSFDHEKMTVWVFEGEWNIYKSCSAGAEPGSVYTLNCWSTEGIVQPWRLYKSFPQWPYELFIKVNQVHQCLHFLFSFTLWWFLLSSFAFHLVKKCLRVRFCGNVLIRERRLIEFWTSC